MSVSAWENRERDGGDPVGRLPGAAFRLATDDNTRWLARRVRVRRATRNEHAVTCSSAILMRAHNSRGPPEPSSRVKRGYRVSRRCEREKGRRCGRVGRGPALSSPGGPREPCRSRADAHPGAAPTLAARRPHWTAQRSRCMQPPTARQGVLRGCSQPSGHISSCARPGTRRVLHRPASNGSRVRLRGLAAVRLEQQCRPTSGPAT